MSTSPVEPDARFIMPLAEGDLAAIIAGLAAGKVVSLFIEGQEYHLTSVKSMVDAQHYSENLAQELGVWSAVWQLLLVTARGGGQASEFAETLLSLLEQIEPDKFKRRASSDKVTDIALGS